MQPVIKTKMQTFLVKMTQKAIYLEYTGDKNGDNTPNADEIGIKHLKGDGGDFRSFRMY